MSALTVIYGPRDARLAHASEALRAHYGCDKVVIGYQDEELPLASPPDTLLLTCAPVNLLRRRLPGARLIEAATARREAGVPARPPRRRGRRSIRK